MILVCLFNKNLSTDLKLVKSTKTEKCVYEYAQKCLENGEGDIYVLDEFATDYNKNLPCVSPDNFVMEIVTVDDKEGEQWRK